MNEFEATGLYPLYFVASLLSISPGFAKGELKDSPIFIGDGRGGLKIG